MEVMKTVSYTKARSELARTMQEVIDDHAPVIITRQDKDSVVMLSLADYEAMVETNYLLQSPANARRLLKSVDEADARRVRTVKIPK
jgi:antitoxin YefM